MTPFDRRTNHLPSMGCGQQAQSAGKSLPGLSGYKMGNRQCRMRSMREGCRWKVASFWGRSEFLSIKDGCFRKSWNMFKTFLPQLNRKIGQESQTWCKLMLKSDFWGPQFLSRETKHEIIKKNVSLTNTCSLVCAKVIIRFFVQCISWQKNRNRVPWNYRIPVWGRNCCVVINLSTADSLLIIQLNFLKS